MTMQKVKLLSTAAASVLLFGIAGASATTTGALPGGVQLAQSSDSGGASPGTGTGGASDTGPQSDGMGTDVTPDVTEPGAATGQSGTESGATTGQSGTESGTTMGETGNTTPMTEQELATRADEIIGKQVVNQQGEEIGEINDVVVDENSQPYAVVGIGGFLGIGEREVAVPASNLDFGADQAVYSGVGSVDEFKSMPEYQQGTWRSVKQ